MEGPSEYLDDVKKVIDGSEAVSKRITDITEFLRAKVTAKEISLASLVDYWLLLRRAYDTIDAARKEMLKYKDYLSNERIPERFADENVKTITTDSGYRITVAYRFSVSMLDKEKAYTWLRDHELGDLIIETVNSGTLSAQIKQMIEKEGIDPPDDIFKQSTSPYTSATKV